MATKKAAKAPKRESIFIPVGYDGNYPAAGTHSFDLKGAISNWNSESGDALMSVIEVTLPAREDVAPNVITIDL